MLDAGYNLFIETFDFGGTMKALILTLTLILSFHANARSLSPADMPLAQQAQLIQVLNQMEPEMLDSILSEEALDWYIGQFTRGGFSEESFNDEVLNTRIEMDGNQFSDANAPVFN